MRGDGEKSLQRQIVGKKKKIAFLKNTNDFLSEKNV